MDREILFRGKRSDNGKWVYGYLDCDMTQKLVFIRTPREIHTDVNMVYPSTVGQYTGLTDWNEKRIFEGDIVRCVAGMTEANMVVIFEDGEFRMVLCERYKTYIPGGGEYYAFRCFAKEVIGNIHDNKNLLKNQELLERGSAT